MENLGELKQATALTANKNGLFWTDGTSLLETSLDGGAAVVLSRSPAGTTPIVDLHAHGSDVFLSARRDVGMQCLGGLFAFSTSTKTVSTIKNACVTSFSVSDRTVGYGVRVVVQNSYAQARAETLDRVTKTVVSLYEGLTEQSGVALGDSYLYMSLGSGRFYRRRIDGSTQLEGVTPSSTVPPDFSYGDERFLTADATGVYGFASGMGSGQKVFHFAGNDDRITQLGADPKEAPANDPAPQGRFAESERHLYWAASSNGEVRRVDRRGKCGMEDVAKGRTRPRWVSFANDSVYWLEDGTKGQPVLARRKLQ